MLPCTQFDISELNLYNYITKDWDVSIPYINRPDRIYDESWTYLYTNLWVTYNGTAKTIYVFVNRYPHDSNGKPIPRITGFNNSGMVLAATDEYWDLSTYEEIPNLNSVPSELQQKRYYVVVDGTVAILKPIMSQSDWQMHMINPTNMPYELTHATTGVIPRIKNHRSYSSWNHGDNTHHEEYTVGSKPLVCNSKGYFFVSYLLAFVDNNDAWTTYELLLDDKYCADKYRRWMTNDGDKIVAFYTQYATNISTSSTSVDNQGYATAANKFVIWTITDASSAPTLETLTLVWSDATIVNNNSCYHMYSWSKLGYLVVAKRRTEPEFIWVDVYGSNGAEMHLVQDAKHARAVENTSYVFYQDMNLTENNKYVFQVFDMSSNDIYKTFTIDDGTQYTINGVYGYNEHLYVRVKSSDNIESTYYFNTSDNSVEKLSWVDGLMSSSTPYHRYDTNIIDDKCLSCYLYDGNIKVYEGTSYSNLFGDGVHTYTKFYNGFPCINSICNGKHLLFTTTGSGSSWGSNVILDLGLILDGDKRYTEHQPYAQYQNGDAYYTEYFRSTTGPIFPFKDGIIKVSSDRYDSYNATTGRICWFPPEMCLPMHMKGTTRTLNSYNAPVNWNMTKKVTWSYTNDLSRLLPGE